MTLDRTHCLYVTGSYMWWRYVYVPDLTPSVFPLIPPLQLITQIHMTHPQIPLYVSATRRRSYNRFRLAVMKVSIFGVCSATFPLLSHSEWPLCWRHVLQWKKVSAVLFDMSPAVSCPPLTCPLLFDLQDCSSSEEYTVAAALLPLSTAFYRVRISVLTQFVCFLSLMPFSGEAIIVPYTN